MSYFDGLVNAAFKKTEDGKVAYYPWGVMAKGLSSPMKCTNASSENSSKRFTWACFRSLFVRRFFSSLGKHSLPEPLAWGIFISSPSV